jgi:hypothetical protein
MSQGGFANDTGGTLEGTVISTLSKKGFEVVPYSKWIKKPDKFGDELLLRNVPFTTIYGHSGKTEFLIKSVKYDMEVRIECKWQQSSGSVDEKFPYLYLNCIEAMPEKNIIIIVEGGGYKQGALQWLKDAVAHRKYLGTNLEKNIMVMSLPEFIAWANRTFRK